MMVKRWLQIRGDPSIREFVFYQVRKENEFDRHLDQVLGQVERLLRERGIFHAKVHFSTGQVTLWRLDDPLRYRVHVKEEFLAPGFCLSYSPMPYPKQAVVPAGAIPLVLARFKRLRTLDEHLYLRSGSLNVVNGLVGLNFSCDGSHYLNFEDFLAKAEDLYR